MNIELLKKELKVGVHTGIYSQCPTVYSEDGEICKVCAPDVSFETSEQYARLFAQAPKMFECLSVILGSFSLERVERYDLIEKIKLVMEEATI